jgi:Uma2 family endonuclease
MTRTVPYSPNTPSKITLEDGSERDVPERMTLEEFSSFPWPQNEAWELIWEVPVLAPRPRWKHQSLMLVLGEFLRKNLTPKDYRVLPEVDVILPPAHSVVVPDLAVFNRSEIGEDERPIASVPVLAIEILSPGTASIDVGPKRDAYAEAGTSEYWTVDPDNRGVAVHVEPVNREYRNLTTDADGYIQSPLLQVSFKITREDGDFHIQTR